MTIGQPSGLDPTTHHVEKNEAGRGDAFRLSLPGKPAKAAVMTPPSDTAYPFEARCNRTSLRPRSRRLSHDQRVRIVGRSDPALMRFEGTSSTRGLQKRGVSPKRTIACGLSLR
jgi:hypothetical protein